MGFNFPNSPTPGQVYSPVGGYSYVWLDGVWRIVQNPQGIGTAQTRNRIVNGAMQISQENSNTAGTINGYHATDQWFVSFLSTGSLSVGRVATTTPNGSKHRFQFYVATGDASLAAGEFASIVTAIEGTRVADFGYGSASARQSILRFGFKAPAGTYSVSVRNGAFNRSYVSLFTIAAGQANTDTVQTFIIPGDTAGTWLTDTGKGIEVAVILAAGSTYQGAAGWQAGAFIGTSANTNGIATTGSIFELFDVGLYLDPNNTGVAPPWVMPDEAEELQACQRYYTVLAGLLLSGYHTAGMWVSQGMALPTAMRSSPAVAFSGISYSNSSALTSRATFTQVLGTTITATATGDAFCTYNAIMNARM